MAKLAIRGHVTRGKEIIELLEMMGGVNAHNLYGDKNYAYYTIDSDKEIKGGIYIFGNEDLLSFTIEEFEEKFPYKVGDKVIFYGHVACVTSMRWDGIEVVYKVKYDDVLWDTIGIHLQPYKETLMYLNEKANKQAEEIEKILEPVKEIMEEIKLDIPDGYEFFGIDDDNKVVLTKKQFLYPNTYEMCCDILDAEPYGRSAGYKSDLITAFRNLLICRDAYWKIAGEQMGLGEPWKPDWLNTEQDKYVLYTHDNVICLNRFVLGHNVLAFPTAEMRDDFLENFKELIELCKELL